MPTPSELYGMESDTHKLLLLTASAVGLYTLYSLISGGGIQLHDQVDFITPELKALLSCTNLAGPSIESTTRKLHSFNFPLDLMVGHKYGDFTFYQEQGNIWAQDGERSKRVLLTTTEPFVFEIPNEFGTFDTATALPIVNEDGSYSILFTLDLGCPNEMTPVPAH